MTAKLTFYGGVNEIGGNKILLQTEDGIGSLDFGRRMGEYSKYFSEFLRGSLQKRSARHASAGNFA